MGFSYIYPFIKGLWYPDPFESYSFEHLLGLRELGAVVDTIDMVQQSRWGDRATVDCDSLGGRGEYSAFPRLMP